jgi:hypothetical protein
MSDFAEPGKRRIVRAVDKAFLVAFKAELNVSTLGQS